MPFIGELSALLTAFLWSGSSIGFATASTRIGSLQLNVNRMILAAIFLSIVILIMNLSYHLSALQVGYLIASGAAGLIFGDYFLFRSFQYVGARVGMLIMSFVPAQGAILAFLFLGETVTLKELAGMFVTLTGIAIVILQRNKEGKIAYVSKAGVFFGFLGALGQAMGLILAKYAFQEGEIHGLIATFVRIISSVLIIFPIVLIARKYKNPVKLYSGDMKALKGTLVGTVFGPCLGITFSLIAIANTKIGIATTLMATVPVIMLPLVWFFNKEKLTWKSVAGAFIAVGGVTVLLLF